MIARFWFLFCATLLLSAVGRTSADDKPDFADKFDRIELGKGWSFAVGRWEIEDGVLRAAEIPADKHAAAARRIIETKDAVYELKFRFVGKGKAFHFGFDPAKGELKKKGHLFSVIVTPKNWKIMKHVDKNRRKEDPNEILAQAQTPFKAGEWYHLKVTTKGKTVTAEVTGKKPLKTTHETFAVRKPTLVFRCVGDGVEVDDIRVRKLTNETTP